MNKIFDIVNKSIIWQNHSYNNRYYFAKYDNKIILLRINNFPDEPLYTFIDTLDIMDIDDLPETWILPN